MGYFAGHKINVSKLQGSKTKYSLPIRGWPAITYLPYLRDHSKLTLDLNTFYDSIYLS